jgi:hypothetical protein
MVVVAAAAMMRRQQSAWEQTTSAPVSFEEDITGPSAALAGSAR